MTTTSILVPDRGARGGTAPLRLTRRGRLVLLGLLVVFALGLTAVAAVASSAASPSPQPRTTRVVVQPGQTLWGIAVAQLPGRDPRAAVQEIRRLSHLSDNAVEVGQELTVPVR
jgi:LysM repeat protein